MAAFPLARPARAVKSGRMPGPKDKGKTDRMRRALQSGDVAALSDDQLLGLLHMAIDVAEDLDELERKIDPHGPPPRHAAMAYQRLRRLKGPRPGKSR